MTIKNRFNVTVDLEDLYQNSSPNELVDSLTPLVNHLHIHRAAATFFVVGSIAESLKSFLNELVQQGHEIALHGYTHRKIEDLGKARFEYETRMGKDLLEDIIGHEVLGYRAPIFSLTRKTPWAPDVLSESGFFYSSSVLPAWNIQCGYPEAPRSPFKWNSGLIELPVPTAGVGQLRLPFFGGAYLRLFPSGITSLAALQARKYGGNWTYCHPYDFMMERKRFPDQNVIMSFLLNSNRHVMLKKTLQLTTDTNSKTLIELAKKLNVTENLKSFPAK